MQGGVRMTLMSIPRRLAGGLGGAAHRVHVRVGYTYAGGLAVREVALRRGQTRAHGRSHFHAPGRPYNYNYQPYGLKTAVQPTFENACLSAFY
jgi:hypothetical protein